MPMIILAKSLKDLDFSKLKKLCEAEIEQIRLSKYKNLLPEFGLLQAENDFYLYLKYSFFPYSGKYFIHSDEERYISAVRFDEYKDGVLLNALVTAPDMRRKGFAESLLRHSLSQLDIMPVYSHIYERNEASKILHEKLGFNQLHNYSRMLDGSLRNDHVTYILNP